MFNLNDIRPEAFLRDVKGTFERATGDSFFIFIFLFVLTFIVFSPARRLVYTPEYVRHYGRLHTGVLKPGPGFIATEAVRFSKLRPVSTIFHLVLIQSFGRRCLPYQLTHFAIHALICFLIYAMVKPWTKKAHALLTGILFCVWPVGLQTETICHLMSLDRELAHILILISYIIWRRNTRIFSSPNLLALGVYILALLTKESVILFPLIFPFLFISFERHRDRPAMRSIFSVLPMAAIAGVYLFLRSGYGLSLRYGIRNAQLSEGMNCILPNLNLSVARMFDIPPESLPTPVITIVWISILILIYVSEHPLRASALVLWIFAAIIPHLHLEFFGSNYVYGAVPVFCFIAAGFMTNPRYPTVKSPTLRTITSMGVIIILCIAGHIRTRQISAPYLSIYAMGEIISEIPCRPSNIAIRFPDSEIDKALLKSNYVIAYLLAVSIERIDIAAGEYLPRISGMTYTGTTNGLRWQTAIRCRPRRGTKRKSNSP